MIDCMAFPVAVKFQGGLWLRNFQREVGGIWCAVRSLGPLIDTTKLPGARKKVSEHVCIKVMHQNLSQR